MCVAFWTLNHPEYALIFCSNRDEYFDRSTRTAHWHNFNQTGLESAEPNVLSGIDNVAGGTWLGINKSGNAAILTNITEPHRNVPSSRGHLCSSFLLHPRYGSEVKLDQYVEELTTAEIPYSGFNLLLLSPSNKSEPSRLRYDFALLSNGGIGNPIKLSESQTSNSSCFGISNNTPSGIDPFTGEQKLSEWPKVAQGRKILDDILRRDLNESDLIEELFHLLRTKERPLPTCREDFQHNIMIESVDLAEIRRGYSFKGDGVRCPSPQDSSKKQGTVSSRYYATRLATVILVRRNGEVVFVERDVWFTNSNMERVLGESGETKHDRRYTFQIRC